MPPPSPLSQAAPLHTEGGDHILTARAGSGPASGLPLAPPDELWLGKNRSKRAHGAAHIRHKKLGGETTQQHSN